MKLTDEQLNYIQGVRFNPLANYELQVEPNKYRKSKKVSETSLADELRLSFIGMNEDSDISFSDDYGNFKYSKVVDSAANRNSILSMQSSTQSLFIWILFKLDYRSDTVEIRLEEVNATGLSMAPGTFNNSLKELEEKGIIKRIGIQKRLDDYWLFHINPQIIWKGDAKQFYKDVLKYHPEYKPKVSKLKPKRPYKRKPRLKDG